MGLSHDGGATKAQHKRSDSRDKIRAYMADHETALTVEIQMYCRLDISVARRELLNMCEYGELTSKAEGHHGTMVYRKSALYIKGRPFMCHGWNVTDNNKRIGHHFV
jgi:hypothetical protein